jgi:hypothetical protein
MVVQTRRVEIAASWIDIVELVFNPLCDVGPPVADVSAYSEAWWSLSSVSPLVEGGYRDSEIVGEFFDGGEPGVVFHALDDG